VLGLQDLHFTLDIKWGQNTVNKIVYQTKSEFKRASGDSLG